MYKYFLHVFFSIKNYRPIWRFLNRKNIALLKQNPQTLSTLENTIYENLKRDGIALSTLDALFPNQNMLKELNDYANTLNPEDAEQGKKSFLKKYWDKHPSLDLNNPFLQLSLSSNVLNIVNKYMDMWTKLRTYDLAKTLPVGHNANAVQSQRWHRDPEEKMLLKVFIYLNDVDAKTGPFTYAYESQPGGKFGKYFPQETPLGVYPDENKLNQIIPKENIKVMTAPAGTVIFCNTAGLHRGGFATEKERIMFTAFYSSDTLSEKSWYTVPFGLEKEEIYDLPPEAVFALADAKRV